MYKFVLNFLIIFVFASNTCWGQMDTLKAGKHTITQPKIVYKDAGPLFPGGQNGLKEYLEEMVIYPIDARKNGVEGQVMVEFLILANGKVAEPKILNDIGSGCGNEVLRVVSEMPAWTPATSNGKPVAVRFSMPFRFTLQSRE